MISVAGLLGQPVRAADGSPVGRVEDIAVRRGPGRYPVVAGIICRKGTARSRIDAAFLTSIEQRQVVVLAVLPEGRDSEADDEMLLSRHVLDHQMVDVDGVRVVRAADLYLARVAEGHVLLAVDVAVKTLLRRVLPFAGAHRPGPRLALGWEQVQPFGRPDGTVRLREPHAALRTLHPAQLAELLSDLGVPQQHELLAALAADHASAALGHLDQAHRRALLRSMNPARAVALAARLDQVVLRRTSLRLRRWPWHPRHDGR